MSLKNTVRSLQSIRAKVNLYALLLVASCSIGVSMVASIGPRLQTAFISLVTSNQASIYDAAYNDTLTLFPSLNDWIELSIDWEFLIFGIIVVYVARRSRRPRAIFISVAATSFLLLSMMDMANLLVAGEFDWVSMFQNIVSNLLGAPIISGILLLIIYSVEQLATFTKETTSWRNIVSVLAPFSIGFGLLLAAYYAASLFYDPGKVNIDATAGPNVSGFYRSIDRAPLGTPSAKRKVRQFGLFAEEADLDGDINWTGKTNSLFVGWKLSNSQAFNASISLYEGCDASNLLQQAIGSQGKFAEFKGVGDVALTLDAGHSDVKIFNDKGIDANRLLKSNDISIDSTQLIGGLLITIAQPDQPRLNFGKPNGAIIVGQNGWFETTSQPSISRSARRGSSSVSALGINGSIPIFRANDVELTPREADNYYIVGNMDIEGDEKRLLHITGVADAIFRGGERLNLTRWERLDWPERSLLLGGITSVFLPVFGLLLGMLRRNRALRMFPRISKRPSEK